MKNLRTLIFFTITTFITFSAAADNGESWAQRVLPLQHQIDIQSPMSEALWLGTHNSFDNANDDSFIDYNQAYSIRGQLDRGIRQIGLDIHYSYGDNIIDKAVRVCHNNTNYNPECGSATGDRKAKYAIDDIAQWLKAGHLDQVVILRLDLSDSARHNINKVEDVIKNHLGSWIYQPSTLASHGNLGELGCTAIPTTLSKKDVLKKGKNVIVITPQSCQSNGGFNDWVFYESISGNKNVKIPSDIIDDARVYRAVDGHTRNGILEPDSFSKPLKIKRSNVKNWLDAGLNIFEFYGYDADGDNWIKQGERPVQSTDMVWSWSEGQPNNDNEQDCAVVGFDGRFSDSSCNDSHYFACRTGDNNWLISNTVAEFNQGHNICSQSGASFSMPHSASELKSLNQLRAVQGNPAVWVAYQDQSIEGVWQANTTVKPHYYTWEYGNTSGGSAFDDTNEISRDLYTNRIRRITSIFMRQGSRVDQVGLNYSDGRSVAHGGSDAGKITLSLATDEHVTGFKLCADSQKGISYRVYYLKLWTNKGRSLIGGTERGSCYSANFPVGYELVGYKGRSGGGVDRLGFITRKYN